ncbi:3-hydroxyacyl-CoA dehydrogenase/enoyl-CoA hydratase family protein [Hoeflea alexandrii]|uniref:3-hydroxyacyl-CoA dehydrogenase/enoyl-CoA hydratase family protein n=1 Tax=Hoeflea alexandrii TaxID=288436 RepID=UPI0022AEF952|nr:3-hydroxyacyl-CoA dehydrogenase/enoyl-CoA hydratase family protein [Hoeflea alexandrii]MCZ4292237.1 3-hydroxyacyl-CoA dehydrogenase NAD-binding domain-containing protein [Hoeflea alexandrii]
MKKPISPVSNLKIHRAPAERLADGSLRQPLRRAAVIGAGSMGSGIAGLIANAGIPVLLLDIVPAAATDRDALARKGVERQLKSNGFMHPDLVSLVEVGNVEDHLHRLSEVDWIIEAVFEDLTIKQDLYARIEEVRKDGAIVSSNTSTIPLHQLVEGLGSRFAGDFVITHFFNPPRVMQLLELVSGPQTRPDILERGRRIGDEVLGKSVVVCRDTPGFIANRVGNYWMSVASLEAMKLGLSVEEADAVMSAPFGIPRTGIFGLFDFVGINLIPLVWGSFMKTLPADDAHRRHDPTQSAFFSDMLARGLVGRAAEGGFYRRRNAAGERVDEVIDFASGHYRPRVQPELKSLGAKSLRDVCAAGDKGGQYAWAVLSNLIVYAATIAAEIADDVAAIDMAIRLGYNWKEGPFQIADRVGAAWIVARLRDEGRAVPPLLEMAVTGAGFYPSIDEILATDGRILTLEPVAGVLSFASIKRHAKTVATNGSASIWDIGDGVAGFEIHTKMNVCDADVVAMASRALKLQSDGFQALVIGSDNHRAFSAGASLDVFIDLVKKQDWAGLDAFVAGGQAAWLGLKYASFPVIAAPSGLALGGGCELMLHADQVVASAELNAGLPERKVGILPGWGGVTQLVVRQQARHSDLLRAGQAAFATIAIGDVSGSAYQAADHAFLRDGDQVVLSRERLLAVAKQEALARAGTYTAPARAAIPAGGAPLMACLEEQISRLVDDSGFTPTDAGICREIARIVSGGSAQAGSLLSEEQFAQLERDGIRELAGRQTTFDRLVHLRNTNRPLAN